MGAIEMRTALSLVILAIAIAGYAHATDAWRLYVNARFGAVADVPADWTAEPDPENGDGRTFTAPDGAKVLVYGNWETGDSVVVDAITSPRQGETITYRFHKNGVYVISGRAGDTLFYRKHVLVCGGKVWVNLEIEYPASKAATYDPMAAHMAKSLHVATDYCRGL